jgi:hypothetical protein
MVKMGTVFDDDFDFIAFSVSKNEKFVPLATQDCGRRTCIPVLDCGGYEECYEDPGICECTSPVEGKSRCIEGTWCLPGCDVCCGPQIYGLDAASEYCHYIALQEGDATANFKELDSCRPQLSAMADSVTVNSEGTAACDCGDNVCPQNQDGKKVFCCPKNNIFFNAKGEEEQSREGKCLTCDKQVFELVDGKCQCRDCDCSKNYEQLTDSCKKVCCKSNNPPADCPECPDDFTCEEPRVPTPSKVPGVCTCQCPDGTPPCPGSKKRLDTNCECKCKEDLEACPDNSTRDEESCECKCNPGFKTCSVDGSCVACDKKLIPKQDGSGCECRDCEEGEVVVQYKGSEYCCEPKGNCQRLSTDGDPCKFCCGDCGDALKEDISGVLTAAGTCVGTLGANQTCESCEACKANAERAQGCNCQCFSTHQHCIAQDRCVKKCNDNRVLNETCQCVCNPLPVCPVPANFISFGNCGVTDDCQCKNPPLCDAITGAVTKIGGVCTCVCRSTGEPWIAGCPQEGLQGPVPPAGGGGGGGGGGGDDGGGDDGGGGDGDELECPPNASSGGDGQCYCNFPQSFFTPEDGGRCACSDGYVTGGDGETCVDPNQPGGSDGIGGSFMESPYDLPSMCDGVTCPEGQSCFQTVFGAECR